jgi:hypothetical protein
MGPEERFLGCIDYVKASIIHPSSWSDDSSPKLALIAHLRCKRKKKNSAILIGIEQQEGSDRESAPAADSQGTNPVKRKFLAGVWKTLTGTFSRLTATKIAPHRDIFAAHRDTLLSGYRSRLGVDFGKLVQ